MRLDAALTVRNLCESRARAQRLIESGAVQVNGLPAKKAAQNVLDTDEITCLQTERYVARSAGKLAPMLTQCFPEGFPGKTGLDIGASTGGFTQLLLEAHCKKVYAVDCGTRQLHPLLRDDPRVVSLENTNARYLDEHLMPEKADVMTVDVSFISLSLLLENLDKRLNLNAVVFLLIKPQFEVGKNGIGKQGVVKDDALRKEAADKITACAAALHWQALALEESPVQGPCGNREWVACFRKGTP